MKIKIQEVRNRIEYEALADFLQNCLNNKPSERIRKEDLLHSISACNEASRDFSNKTNEESEQGNVLERNRW